ncbi:MAG: hypothetical protein MJY42_01390 [Bacteroidales bacterium]|nr:hypothetical protein [Bacteroidales bacterium]
MKKIFLAFVALAVSCAAYSQTQKVVPMSVYIPEDSPSIPAQSSDMLLTRMRSAVVRSGMAATDDVTQFYLTCKSDLVDKHIIPGAPTKYSHAVEMTFFVVDALAQKIFSTTTIEAKGVGNSEQQAYTSSFKSFSPANASVQKFLKDANVKILQYYDDQYRNIIAGANALAGIYKYEEALFRLSTIPEACVGYQEAVDAGLRIYKKYIDDRSRKALMKARTIWNAGQDSAAAAEAGEYLAEIDPDASCYAEAIALNEEIKARVKSDIDYYRKIEQRDAEYAHTEKMSSIEAWRAVGVAYGNGQKTNYYKSTF